MEVGSRTSGNLAFLDDGTASTSATTSLAQQRWNGVGLEGKGLGA